MKRFTALASRAHDLVCPQCGTCSLEVLLRCDLAEKECLTVARCANCRRQFPAEGLPTYDELYRKVADRALHRPCPRCHGMHRRVRSTCDRLARQCFFVISCESCGHVRTC